MKVPEPRKLKSGNYFVQLRLGGESIPVTAPTAKECKRQAGLIKAEYQAGKRKTKKTDLTLGQIIDNYIAKYETVLSPSTIRGYSSIRKNRFKAYMNIPYSEIKDWQAVINDELEIVGEKTVKNGWGVVTPALEDIGLDIPEVKLAKVPDNELPFLEPEEIPLFLAAARDDSAEIEMLLELHGLRESETMYVVRHDLIDLQHNVINVRGAMVPNKEHKYVDKKTNKTASSTRVVPIMIPRLAELVQYHKDSGMPIRTHSASTLLSHVHKTCLRAGVTDVPNHGLRRTFASLGYSLQIPERNLMELGGWDDPGTMHKIYIKLAARDKERAKNAMADFYRPKNAEDLYREALDKLSEFRETYADIEGLKPVFDAIEKIESANKIAN